MANNDLKRISIEEIEKYIIGKEIKNMSTDEIRNFIEAQGNVILVNQRYIDKQNNIINGIEEYLKAMIGEVDTFRDPDTVSFALSMVDKKIKELKAVK